jgi:hypothetical protein
VLVPALDRSAFFAAAGGATRLCRSREELAALAPAGTGAFATVLALPKSAYLRKVFEVAREGEADASAILDLHVEAWLPPEYGPRVTCIRRLGPGAGGGIAYEVFVVKARDWADWRDGLRTLGLNDGLILPAALLWLATGPESLPAVLADMGDGRWELAYPGVDKGMVVRSLTARPGGPDVWAEAVAALPSQVRGDGGDPSPVTVCGTPPTAAEGLIPAQTDLDPADPCPFASCAAAALARVNLDTLRPWNLIAPEVAEQLRRRGMHRLLVRATMCYLGALVLFATGLKALDTRATARAGQLAAEVRAIRVDGQRTGQRLQELTVVRATTASREQVLGLFEGLLKNTPDGMTYNRITVDATGAIQLRGQADSLSKPYELPQRLEQVYPFQNVKCSQAFTTHTSTGVAAEFQIDAQVVSGGTRAQTH